MRIRFNLPTLLCVSVCIMGATTLIVQLVRSPEKERAYTEFLRVTLALDQEDPTLPMESLHYLIYSPHAEPYLRHLDREYEQVGLSPDMWTLYYWDRSRPNVVFQITNPSCDGVMSVELPGFPAGRETCRFEVRDGEIEAAYSGIRTPLRSLSWRQLPLR